MSTEDFGLIEAHGVVFTSLHWVPGLRAVAYFGVVAGEVFIEGRASEVWEKAQDQVLGLLAAEVRTQGGTHVVNLDLKVDPSAQLGGVGPVGLRIEATGTSAQLVPLF